MIFGMQTLMRNTILGLMFVLAVTAACSCDSYDPNPYDDIPPVVTVEFNYVVPHQVSALHAAAQIRSPQLGKLQHDLAMMAPGVVAFLAPLPVQAISHGSPPLIAPLRC